MEPPIAGPARAGRRGARFHAAALAVSLLLALAETWPLAPSIATHFPTRAPVSEPALDQMLTSWILASDVRRLSRDPLKVLDTNNMHPFQRTLAYSENLLGMALAVAPVQLA